MGMAVTRTAENCQFTDELTANFPRANPGPPSNKLTRNSVKEGLPAPEPRQLVLDIRVLAQLVRDPPTHREGEGAVPTTACTTVAGVVRSAHVLLKENDLGHDPYLVVRLREEVEPDAGQSDPERLVPGPAALVVAVVAVVNNSSIPRRRGRGPVLALVITGTPPSIVFFRGSAFRIGDCCPVHADTWGPAKVAPGED